jgi:hypothetical protein
MVTASNLKNNQNRTINKNVKNQIIWITYQFITITTPNKNKSHGISYLSIEVANR